MRPRTAHNLRGPACSLCDIIKFGYFHQVRALISTGIDLEARDDNDRTPLLLCPFMEPPVWGVSIAMTLIEGGANMSVKDCFKRNVLHYACIYERVKLVRILLKAVDFDLNQTDHLGNSPLHYAATSGNVAITELLVQSLKRYRISMSKRNHRGRTALDEALLSGGVPCTRIIQEGLAAKQGGNVIKDVRFADAVMNCGSSSADTSREPSLTNGERPSRPKTAAVTTRHAYALEDVIKSGSKSPLTAHTSTRNIWSSQGSKGFKRDEDLIFSAPRDDFRNKPEYVFRLVRKPYDPGSCDPMTHQEITYRSNWTDSSGSIHSQQMTEVEDWRNQFQVLFQVYEHQCSPSWRIAKVTESPGLEQDTPTPSGEELESDDKDMKSARRQSLNSRNSNYTDTKRRQSTVRLSKLRPKEYSTDANSLSRSARNGLLSR
ncbi:hypothetical protein Btru_054742 [Bulinus truncatus]|nr:hypothetical protein Btru_054742 [Bulinus truncatus]